MCLMQFTHVTNMHMHPLNLKKKLLKKKKVGEGDTSIYTTAVWNGLFHAQVIREA